MEVRRAANKRGMSPFVILTGIDKICEHVEKDTSKVFHSQNIQKMVKLVGEKSGIAENKIFPMRNYYKETQKDPNIDFLTMMVLRQIVRFADGFVEDLVDE